MVYYADEEHPRKRLKLWDKSGATLLSGNMEDFNSETDSDYTSYWRDWVSEEISLLFFRAVVALLSSLNYVKVPTTWLWLLLDCSLLRGRGCRSQYWDLRSIASRCQIYYRLLPCLRERSFLALLKSQVADWTRDLNNNPSQNTFSILRSWATYKGFLQAALVLGFMYMIVLCSFMLG